MENKKIDILFGIVVIAFLIVTIFLIKDFNAKRTNDYKEYTATISNIVKLKNFKIVVLANELKQIQQENVDLKNTLTDTRNDLDALSKKLAQPAPAAAPVSMPTPAHVPASATVPVSATATK